MLKKSLRCFIGLAVVAAFASPAAAQQRPSDPLTRFLDGIFKPNQGQGVPAAEPQAVPAPQAAEPAPAAPVQAQPQPEAKPKTKIAAPKPKAPAKQQVAQPMPPPQSEPQAAAAPVPEVKAAPEPQKPVQEEAPIQAAEKKAPEPAPVKAAAPPKPAGSTPAQAVPTPTPVAAAAAATPVSPPNPTSPAAALERVNAYFNAIDTMSAYFTQKNPNGQQVEGTLSVRRPGQLHFAYAPPSMLEIVSDGRNVAIRDKKLGTNDVYPVSQTPLKFLVQDNVDLARDTKVRDVQIGRDGMITVNFDDRATMGGTSKIALRFDSRANVLKQWTVVDSQGYETTVVLSGLNVVQRRNASAAN